MILTSKDLKINSTETNAEIEILRPNGHRVLVYVEDGEIVIASMKSRLVLELISGNRIKVTTIE